MYEATVFFQIKVSLQYSTTDMTDLSSEQELEATITVDI